MPENQGRKRIVWIAGAVVFVLAAAIIALPLVVDANQFRPMIEERISDSIGRETRIGNLKLSLLSGSIRADGITIADDPKFSRSPSVRAESLKVEVELVPLIFSKTLSVTGIALERPEITLIRSSSGAWNFSSIGPKGAADPPDGPDEPESPAAAEVRIKALQVIGGRVNVIGSGGEQKPLVFSDVGIQARDLSLSAAFPFVVTASLPGVGSVELDGSVGPINRQDASLTPLTVAINVKQFDVLKSRLVEPESGLAAIIGFEGNITSDGSTAVSKGQSQVRDFRVVKAGAVVARPLLLEYVLRHNLKNQSGALSETKATFGDAALRLSGGYDMSGRSTVLKLKLRGDDVRSEEVEALLPAVGVTLPRGASLQGGKLHVDLSVDGPVEKLVTTGNVGLADARLAGFDLGTKLSTVASLAGIQASGATEIERFSSDLRITPDGIRAGNLQLIVPSIGKLAGEGNVSANNALDFHMIATVNPSKVTAGALGRLVGARADRDVDVPFFIRGTTSDPNFVPDAKGSAQSLLDTVAPETGEKGLGDAIQRLLGRKKQ